ncbi:MAG TPA: MucB/RseB C-terminal domain-containing protein [Woeseiaceae bacterium]|nr:MucB/RseB C-terminal domain-containing protein [Woeseiaceae bacterium]
MKFLRRPLNLLAPLPRQIPASAWLAVIACCKLLLVTGNANAAESPKEWLERMAHATQSTDYEGTVVRISGGKAEVLKVVHSVADGVVREKLIAQEGDGLEIIRNGNEVHCIIPGKRSVLIEEWNDQSTLFTTLPSRKISFGSEYDVRIVTEGRVAGRKSLTLAIKPHDQYRYEHRIWLDAETAFPLQTQLIDAAGDAIEQVKFADISLGNPIPSSALSPTNSTENFTWYNPPARSVKREIESEWECDELPIGFELVSVQQEQMPGSDEVVTHMLYSDGLASVSVFVAAKAGETPAKRSQVGASNSFSTVRGGYRITAVGEVPAVTVEKIASSMRLR